MILEEIENTIGRRMIEIEIKQINMLPKVNMSLKLNIFKKMNKMIEIKVNNN